MTAQHAAPGVQVHAKPGARQAEILSSGALAFAGFSNAARQLAVVELVDLALVILPTQPLLKVSGPNLGTFAFDISTGQQANSPDSAQCLWASEWQIIIRENDKDHVLFERND